MTARRGHREVDHSGDVGVEAWAPTRAQLLEELTFGLLALVAPGVAGGTVERAVEARSPDTAALMVDWLNEVILVAATHGEVYSMVRVDVCDARGARGVLAGERIDPGRHSLRFDVKAATYHGLDVQEDAGGWHARVIFDL